MNRKKIYLIVALMGLSITGITLMQVHWMLKTIKLNEENFDRAVNESLTSVVDKLEKEKNLKFSLPVQSPFWTKFANPAIDSLSYPFEPIADIEQPLNDESEEFENSTQDWFNYQQEQLDSIIESQSEFIDFGYESYAANSNDEQELKLKFLDSVKKVEVNRYGTISKDLGQIKFYSNYQKRNSHKGFADTIDRSVRIIQNGDESKIIIITNGITDTLDYRNISSNLIPPPPPPSMDDIVVSVDEFKHYPKIQRNQRPLRNPSLRYRTDSSIMKHNFSNFRYFNSLSEQQKQRRNKELDENLHKIEQQKIKLIKDKKIATLTAKRIELQKRKQEQAISQLAYEIGSRKMELKDRVNFDELKNLLTIELKNKGILNSFEYALVNLDSTRKVVHSSKDYNIKPNKSIYATRLFPNNIIPLNDYIEVKFPDKDFTIYRSAILPISASLFFTLIVFLTFIITLVIIIKQKKLAEMKADFINNMTHELKTPIATISLASDSIDNPKVVDKPETVKYFTSIIREENSRMNKLVESVLQTARLERKTLKLNLKKVNLSTITSKVAEQMSIQAKAKGGEIHLDILADVSIIADENLMQNVIFNLIDNAIKYSASAPIVGVFLKKLPGGVSLSVEDNGIGISRSEQQHVFEKFYRVSQGDVHNIKGFGLGLSNVKEITELHGGMVQLRSELGKGSTFTLFFPFKTNGNE